LQWSIAATKIILLYLAKLPSSQPVRPDEMFHIDLTRDVLHVEVHKDVDIGAVEPTHVRLQPVEVVAGRAGCCQGVVRYYQSVL